MSERVRIVRRVAYRFGRWNRHRKARFAVAFGRRHGVRTVLLVGAAGVKHPVNNLIEHELHRHFPYVVTSGLATSAEGWDTYVAADGLRLPFRDDAFDLVFSNAVIEHVGDEVAQQRFVEEVTRVGRSWIITTPNRWFPIEAHHHTFLSHWAQGWAPHGTVTRLLGVRELRNLLPGGSVRGLPVLSPTLMAVSGYDARGTTASPRRGRDEVEV